MNEERLPDLFLEAIELDAAGQRDLLARIAAEDPALAAELGRMLARPADAASPVDGSAISAAGVFAAEQAPEDPQPPARVGPFRLGRELGRGGMGRVYLAEQETEHYRRTVALKIIQVERGGEEAVRRFREEVRILAALDHPNIVRFFHGGRSLEGIWFLAIEYVEGVDLVTHVRRRELPVEEILDLVLAVAEAVAYAHARGVIHRDIKPSNVLVGADGRPRLLDFGISKLLDTEPSLQGLTTRQGPRWLTPAYASPEQMAGAPGTAASDVYSLGVVLYELLTGARPLGVPGVPPSGVVPPGKAAPGARIDRDLDAICLMALAADPAQRYADGAALAADLRHRKSGHPLAARRRTSGAISRGNRRIAVAALAGLGMLAAGVAGVAFVRSKAGGAVAAATAVASTRFPFDAVNPPPAPDSERRLAEVPDDLVAGAALVIRLARDRRTDEAKIALGRVRQIPGAELDPLIDFAAGELSRRSGEDQAALVLFTRALDRAIQTGRNELVGTLRLARGALLLLQGQREPARVELEAARVDLERADDARPLYRALNELAVLSFQAGELDRGEAMFERAVEVARRGGFEPLIALSNLAEVKLQRGRPDLAEPLARAVLPELRGHPDPGRPADALVRLSVIVRDLGRSTEAASLVDEALALVADDAKAPARGTALFARALADLERGDLGRIDATVRELESVASTTLRKRPLGYARTITARRDALAGRLEPARRGFAEARRLFESEGDRDLAAAGDLALAAAELDAGNLAAAKRTLEALVAGLDPAARSETAFFAEMLHARLDAADGRADEALRRLAAAAGSAEQGADSPSVSRRIAFLRARAAAGGGAPGSSTLPDLAAAQDAARAAGREVDALALALDRAVFEPSDVSLGALERDARTRGLTALAERARRTRGA